MRKAVFPLAALVLLLQLAQTPATAQETVSGTWSAQTQSDGRISLQLSSTDEHGHNSNGKTVEAAELGIAGALAARAQSPVSFTLQREPGAIVCSGVAGNGKGAGIFTFTPSRTFEDALRARGYERQRPQQLLAAAMLDIRLAFIDGFTAAGYARPPFEALLPLRALGADGPYASAMNTAFGRTTELHELIPLRALHVTPEFMRDLRAGGVPLDSAEDAIRLRALHIDAAYLRRVQAHGFAHPTVDDLVRLKAMNIVSLQRGGRAG